jgi:hypothetical protein
MIQRLAASPGGIDIQAQRLPQFGLPEVLRQPARTQGMVYCIIVGFLGVERASIHHPALTVCAAAGSKKISDVTNSAATDG